jgi:hypothetical protein
MLGGGTAAQRRVQRHLERDDRVTVCGKRHVAREHVAFGGDSQQHHEEGVEAQA